MGRRAVALRRTADAARTGAAYSAPAMGTCRRRVDGSSSLRSYGCRRLTRSTARPPRIRPFSCCTCTHSTLSERCRTARRAVTQMTPQSRQGGEIQRDRHGNPSGLLIARPNALILYATLAKGPKLSFEDQRNSTRHFMRELNRLGITSVIDAGGGFQNYPEDYAVIEDLRKRGNSRSASPTISSPSAQGRRWRTFPGGSGQRGRVRVTISTG